MTSKTGNILALIIFLAILVAAGLTQSAAPSPTPKAVFIIVDGIPADVLEETSTPVLDSSGCYDVRRPACLR